MRERKRPVDPTVGRHLAEWRKRRHLTQAALAKSVGVAVSTVKDWERGRVQLSTGRIQQLALSLECPPAALWQPPGKARE